MVNWNARIPIDRRIVLGVAFAATIVFGIYTLRMRRTPAQPPTVPPQAAKQEPAPAVVQRVPPSPEDIANLGSSDHAVQYSAAHNLVDRELTPELIAAIRAAPPTSRYGNQWLHCLQARLPGPEGLESALQLPDGIGWLANDGADEAKCKIPVLVERKDEAPDRIAEVLGRYAIDMNGAVIGPAVAALKHVPATKVPQSLEDAMLRSGDSSAQAKALDAAAEMGGARLSPKVLADALDLDDWRFRHRVAYVLARASDSEAAAIIARALVRHPRDTELLNALASREGFKGDGYRAVADIALDEARNVDERTTALELLADARDPKLVPILTPLTRSPDSALRTYAAAAIAQVSRTR